MTVPSYFSRPVTVSQLKADRRADAHHPEATISPTISSENSDRSNHCSSDCESPSSSGQEHRRDSMSRHAASTPEDEKALAARVKALYKKMAEAALGRLLSKNPSELKYYTSYCESCVSALLELQDRQTVTRISRTIVSRIQIRLASARSGSASGSARPQKLVAPRSAPLS